MMLPIPIHGWSNFSGDRNRSPFCTTGLLAVCNGRTSSQPDIINGDTSHGIVVAAGLRFNLYFLTLTPKFRSSAGPNNNINTAAPGGAVYTGSLSARILSSEDLWSS